MRQLAQHRKRRNKSCRRLTAVLLSGMVAVTSCLAGTDLSHAAGLEDAELQNPRVEMNTCDTVYFGNYWQEDTNGDGVADRNDEQTPIRWRILSQNGNDAYVLADRVLDYKPYHETYEGVTWETSTLRKWLNEEFYNTAFTPAEQEAVLEQTLVNADNDDEEFNTEGGADTVDKVYLPSLADMQQESYGFSTDRSFCDQARIGKATAYVERQGADTTGEKGSWWWLRSPGGDTDYAAEVISDGGVATDGGNVGNNDGVRPVLHLDLSSPLVQQGDKMGISLEFAAWDLVELGTYEGKALTWRVLQRSGNDVFLLSDQILAGQKYHETYESITWRDSTLRAWLNGEFYQEAFTGEEKAGIQSYLYENRDNPWFGTEGGEDSTDYISLLSLEDVVNPEYGFPTDYYCEHAARIAHSPEEDRNSRYGSWWWLRSPGGITFDAAFVKRSGYVLTYGLDASSLTYGVRPALHFDLSSQPLSKVGTITAETEGEYWENDPANPNVTEKPGATKQPGDTDTPATPSSATPVGSGGTDPSGTAGTASVSGSTTGTAKNQPTKLNIKNKKKYALSRKLTIRDADGIRSVKLNGKTIKIKAGKRSISFKLSKYKKMLKKKGKWNRLVITDRKGKKKTVKFKIK